MFINEIINYLKAMLKLKLYQIIFVKFFFQKLSQYFEFALNLVNKEIILTKNTQKKDNKH